MSKTKNAKLIYVAAIPKEQSGIGRDVPAHIKVEFLDEQGRRNTMILDLPADGVEQIAKLPNV